MAKQFRVAITDFITGDLSPENKLVGDIADVVAYDGYDESELVGKVETADALMLYHSLSITKKTIANLKNCKLIVRCGVGYDNVDWRYARERGIAVANVPDYGTEEVADSAIGLMLSLTRGINLLNVLLQPGHPHWTYKPAAPLYRLRGRVFGCIGLGRIGTAAALRAKAFGMDVVYYDPYAPHGDDKSLGIRQADTLEELLKQAFVVSVHTPLTEETRHMIDAKALSLLPKGSYLVNTARGAIVDTAAIPAAIASGQLAGAGIDVLAMEPPPENDPLLVAWRDPANPCHTRVILNPHSAFYSEEGLLDMRLKGAKAVRNALLGKPVGNVVN